MSLKKRVFLETAASCVMISCLHPHAVEEGSHATRLASAAAVAMTILMKYTEQCHKCNYSR